MGMRYDIDLVREYARPHTLEILVRFGGLDPDLLSGQHCPCPKCGGTDRFRYDTQKHFIICNQCFNRGNGDIFAALMWCTGKPFLECLTLVAEYLGVKPTIDDGKSAKKDAKPKADPAEHLEFTGWNDTLVARWCSRKPPITPQAVLAAGGRLARYRNTHKVIAFPIYGEARATVGWVIYNITGGTLPAKNGAQVKSKITYGSGHGMLGDLARIDQCKTLWKVEGVTDLLTFLSLENVPQDVTAVTNASGCSEHPKPFMLRYFEGREAIVCHDADTPGQRGAVGFTDERGKFRQGWCQEIAAATGKPCKNVVLPYEISENHGKDLRDFATENAVDFTKLMELPVVEVAASHKVENHTTPTETKQVIVTNFFEVAAEGDKTEIQPIPMAQVLERIGSCTESWPRRVGNALFVHDGAGVHWLENSSALFGWLGSKCGVIEWRKSMGCVTKDEVFHELCRTARNYVSVETLPHFPPLPDHYYACPEYPAGNGDAIDKLINFFSPETEADKDLILAMFCTPFWGGKPGSKPAFLITSDSGRGVGKSKITDMLSCLLGGHIELSSSEDAGRMRSRFLSSEGLKLRLARLDNVKTLRFSWAELESVITSPNISGHRLHMGEASRPNNLTWVITLNGASLSTDMAQRVIIIKLRRPRRIGAWESDVVRFIHENREAIISDIRTFFEMEPSPVPDHSRWAAWEDEVVGRLVDPEAAKHEIKTRSVVSDVEVEEMNIVQAGIEERIRAAGYCDTSKVFISSQIIASWYNAITGQKRETISASQIINQFITEGGITKLQKHREKSKRGFVYFGEKCFEVPEEEIYFDLQDRLNRDSDGQKRFF